MKKILFILSIFIVTLSSCNVLKCSTYNSNFQYNEDKTKVSTCIECETNNRELKNAFIRLIRNIKK
jgi:hypothetical protein